MEGRSYNQIASIFVFCSSCLCIGQLSASASSPVSSLVGDYPASSKPAGVSEKLDRQIVELNDDLVYTPLGKVKTKDNSELLPDSLQLPRVLTFKAVKDEPVINLIDGLVISAAYNKNCNYSSVTVREYGSGYQYSCSQITDCTVKTGETVKRGQVLGKVYGIEGQTCSLTFATATEKSINSAEVYLRTLPARLKHNKTLMEHLTSQKPRISFKFQDYNKTSIAQNPWKEEEKLDILWGLDKIKKDYPSLYRSLEQDGAMVFVRSSVIKIRKQDNTAATDRSTIFFTDSYFRLLPKDRMQCLIHELSHKLDRYNFVKFSPEWIAFAGPKIKQFRGFRHHSFGSKWPSEYACTNLSEALADYSADVILGKHLDDSRWYRKTIEPSLLGTDSKKREWTALLDSLFDTAKSNNVATVEKRLQRAQSLFPDKPFTTVCVAYCRFRQERNEEGLEACKKLLAQIKTLNPLAEDHAVKRTIGNALNGAKGDKVQKDCMDKLLSIYPDDPQLKELQGYYKIFETTKEKLLEMAKKKARTKAKPTEPAKSDGNPNEANSPQWHQDDPALPRQI